MRAWVLAAIFLIGLAPFAACGSGTAKNNTTSTLKELHDPKLAVTATPPDRLPTPLVANSAPGVGGGSAGAAPDTYVVKAGDTLGAIASQLGVTVADLAAANQITNPASIQVGQQLKVPKAGVTPTPTPPSGTGPTLSTPAPGSTSASGGGQVPPTGGAPSGGGAIGSPAPGAAATAAASAGGPTSTYTVKAGDSACAIAIANGVSLQELADANGMSKAQIAKLSLNQPLKIPARTGHTGC